MDSENNSFSNRLMSGWDKLFGRKQETEEVAPEDKILSKVYFFTPQELESLSKQKNLNPVERWALDLGKRCRQQSKSASPYRYNAVFWNDGNVQSWIGDEPVKDNMDMQKERQDFLEKNGYKIKSDFTDDYLKDFSSRVSGKVFEDDRYYYYPESILNNESYETNRLDKETMQREIFPYFEDCLMEAMGKESCHEVTDEQELSAFQDRMEKLEESQNLLLDTIKHIENSRTFKPNTNYSLGALSRENTSLGSYQGSTWEYNGKDSLVYKGFFGDDGETLQTKDITINTAYQYRDLLDDIDSAVICENRSNNVRDLLVILSNGDTGYKFQTRGGSAISLSYPIVAIEVEQELFEACQDKLRTDVFRFHVMDDRYKSKESLLSQITSQEHFLHEISSSVPELSGMSVSEYPNMELRDTEKSKVYFETMERYLGTMADKGDAMSGNRSLLEDLTPHLRSLRNRYDWIQGNEPSAATDPRHFKYDSDSELMEKDSQEVWDKYKEGVSTLVNDYIKYKDLYEQQEGVSFSQKLEEKDYLDSVKAYVDSMRDRNNPLSGDFLGHLPKDGELEKLFNRYYSLEEEGSRIRFGLLHESGYVEKLQGDFKEAKDAFNKRLTEVVNDYMGIGSDNISMDTVQGLEQYDREDIKSLVEDFFNERFEGVDDAPTIKGIEVYGSRGRGTAKVGSDLDVVVEYDGDWKEDDVFNLLHEEDLSIEGVPVDINPITEGQSGNLEKYMEKVRQYDEQQLGQRDSAMETPLREQRQAIVPSDEEDINQRYAVERAQVGYSGFYRETLDRHDSWRDTVNDLYARADEYYRDAKVSHSGDAAELWKQGREFEEAGDTLLHRLHAENLWKSENVDHDYLFAIKRGDMQAAQQMVNEAARRAGYSLDSSYQGTSAFNGSAPWGNGYYMSTEERKQAWENGDLDGEQTLGDYIKNGVDCMNLDFIALDPRNYRAMNNERKEAIINVRNAINAKSDTITMYRSVPSDVKEESFRNGDWITPSRSYAVDNAAVHGWGDKFRIIEQEVPVDEIWWDGNDIAEWGYGREQDYVNDKDFAYKNTANNRKLLDAVVYDDNGDIIPLSKRFNENVSDIRYQTIPTQAELNREERELRDTLIGKLRSAGIDVITDVKEGQYVLDKERKSARTMSFGDAYDYDRYPLGRVEPNLAEAIVNVVPANINHGFKDYREASEWAYKNICRTYDQEETGGKGIVKINSDIVDKYVSKTAREKSDSDDLHYAVLKVLPELIREGIDAETHPNFRKVGDVRSPEFGMDKNLLMHRVYAAVSINGSLCRVKISMKENMTGNNIPNKPYSYEVTDISTKIEPLGPIGVQARSEDGIPISSITGAKLLKNAEMSYDKGKKLLDESKKISKSVREQRVYHGSGANFDHFDFSQMRQGEGNLAFGWGGYVTTSKAIGKSYATMMDYDRTRTQYRTRYSNGQRFLRKWPSLEAFLSDEKVKASSWSDHEKVAYYKNHAAEAEPYHNLYEVEIPADNGKNYLDWYAPLEKEKIEKIQVGLAHLMDNPAVSSNLKNKLQEWNNGYNPVINVDNGMTGEKVYKTISESLLDENTSKFLSSLGFTGIKYPAGSIMGGAKSGDTNYVIFKEDDMKIKDHLRFFKSKGGETYGYTVGGKIYVDPRVATAETPIHEYTHLWATAMQKGNPREWSNIVGLMKDTTVWNEVKETYPELRTDDAIADEVLATYSGRRGAEKLRQMSEDARNGLFSASKKASVEHSVFYLQAALDKFWKAMASFLGIHYNSAEQVADQVMKDMLSEVNPSRQLRAFVTARDERYKNAVERGDINQAFRLVKEQANMMLADNPMPEVTDAYRVRDINPTNTIKVYKVFTMDKEGNPTAMFVSGKDKLPVGVWMDAQDTWHFRGENGRDYIPSTRNPNGRGNKTGISMPIPSEEVRQELIKRGYLPEGSTARNITVLAYRPGWHAADLPYFPQGGKQQAESNYGNVHRHNHVVFECELAADVNYTEKAHAQYKAHRADGTFIPRNADLQWMPKDGFYQYTTNQFLKDEDKGHWYIGGALRINRALTQEECDKILADNGKPAQEWEQGLLDLKKLGYATDTTIHTKPVLAPTAYDEKGNLIPLSRRFAVLDEKSHLGRDSQDRIRRLFVGERGARTADIADNVRLGVDNQRLELLNLAKTMLKKESSQKEIKQATGWELGADGSWRFEMPDVRKFDWYGNLSYAREHPDYQRFSDLKQKQCEHLFDEGEALRPSEEQELDILSEKYGGEEKKLDGNHTLEAYVDAPDVFKAYPDLRNVKVEFKPLDDQTMAYYQGKTLMDYMFDGDGMSTAGTMVINTKRFSRFTDPKILCPVVAHEMQHAVQQIEGFAKGGSLESVKKDIQDTLNSSRDHVDYIKYNLKMWATYESAAKKLEMYKQYGPETEVGKLKRFSWYWDAMNEVDSNLDDKFQLVNNYEKDLGKHLDARDISETGYHVDEAIAELKRVAGEHKDSLCKQDYITLDRMNRLDDVLQESTEAQMYHNLAGEVEARNTESRYGMTTLQRRNSLASDTEDVDRRKQIVIFRTEGQPSRTDEESQEQGRWHTPEVGVREVYAEYGKFLSSYLREVGTTLHERMSWSYKNYVPVNAEGQRFKGVTALMLALSQGNRPPVFFTRQEIQQQGYVVDDRAKPFPILKGGGVVNLYNLSDLWKKSETDPKKYVRVSTHSDFGKKYEEWAKPSNKGIDGIDAFDKDKYPEFGIGDLENGHTADYNRSIVGHKVFDKMRELDGKDVGQSSEKLISCLGHGLMGQEYGYEHKGVPGNINQLAARLERDPEYVKHVLDEASRTYVKSVTFIEESVRTWSEDKKLDLRSLTPIDVDSDGNGIVDSEENLVADTKQCDGESEEGKKHEMRKMSMRAH